MQFHFSLTIISSVKLALYYKLLKNIKKRLLSVKNNILLEATELHLFFSIIYGLTIWYLINFIVNGRCTYYGKKHGVQLSGSSSDFSSPLSWRRKQYSLCEERWNYRFRFSYKIQFNFLTALPFSSYLYPYFPTIQWFNLKPVFAFFLICYNTCFVILLHFCLLLSSTWHRQWIP